MEIRGGEEIKNFFYQKQKNMKEQDFSTYYKIKNSNIANSMKMFSLWQIEM